MAKGKIGVSTQDLFPIIKKFLYSDHEIFLREIVANAIDATQKLKVLASSGEFKGGVDALRVEVKLDKEAGTLTISDSGIGMTQEEVDKYINQIAFSGAEEFLNKYKDNAAAIIGHFGLGFYSAFMVSDKVEILTLSYKEGAKAVRWSCSGTTDYELEEAQKAERGTDIILHISEEEKDFLEESKIEGLLNKYCKFLPVEIVFGKEKEWKDGKYEEIDKDRVINNTQPAWTKKPSELKDEDYSAFYRELYPYQAEPLFNIHLNVDYPFNLTGILYFPKINSRLELQKNKIQLYCNQVYVTDSVEGIVPDYLTLLHGVIDSPDIPLNVSRSYLQSDRNVKKISSHITKKVADSLEGLFKNERKDFEQKWDDLKIFVQYGVLTDEKFAERAEKFYLLKNSDGKYFSLEEYKEAIKDAQTDKNSKIVFLYASSAQEQYTYINAAKSKGYDVVMADGQLEVPFINYLEQKHEDWKFVRVDSDSLDRLIEKEEVKNIDLSQDCQRHIKTLFASSLPKESMYEVELRALGEAESPVQIARSEYMRRMKEMADINPQMAFYGAMGERYSLILNVDNALVKKLCEAQETALKSDFDAISKNILDLNEKIKSIDEINKDAKAEDIPQSDKDRKMELENQISTEKNKEEELISKYGQKEEMVGQLIDLALLANGLLKGEALDKFIKRSFSLIK